MQQKEEKTTQHANLPLEAYLQKQQTRALQFLLPHYTTRTRLKEKKKIAAKINFSFPSKVVMFCTFQTFQNKHRNQSPNCFATITNKSTLPTL